METLLRFGCPACQKTFVVEDLEIDEPEVFCPHCQETILVPEYEDDDEE